METKRGTVSHISFPSGGPGATIIPGYEQRQSYEPRSGNGGLSWLGAMHLGSITVLVLCALSCMIALHRNTRLMEQNLDILAKQLKSPCYTDKGYQTDVHFTNKRFERVKRSKDTCPPCPTEGPPTPIEPFKNPVSVLNQEVGKDANYEVVHTCVNPPVHHSTLRILNDPAFEGKTWTGKGSSKQSSKQAAAWKAIQSDFPYLVELVGDEYVPPEYFDPICNRPPTP